MNWKCICANSHNPAMTVHLKHRRNGSRSKTCGENRTSRPLLCIGESGRKNGERHGCPSSDMEVEVGTLCCKRNRIIHSNCSYSKGSRPKPILGSKS